MNDTFDAPSTKDNIIPRFYMKPVKNEFKSNAEGREVWDEVEYVEMFIPGDKLTEVHEKVKDHHRERWAPRYAAFKESREAPSEGTPLEEWAGIGAAQVMELKSCHSRRVEHLAGLADSQLSKSVPMGGQALREKAQRYVSQESESDRRIRQLEEQIALLTASSPADANKEKDQAA